MSVNPIRKRRLAILLAFLTLASVPLALVTPPASAQIGSDIRMSLDREPANYMQGDTVHVFLNGTLGPQWSVTVRCVSCDDRAKTYSTTAEPHLRFPEDFGQEATNDAQPRWNGTWRVNLEWGESVMETRYFHVWLGNVYEFPDHTPMPSTTVRFRSVDLDPEETYAFEVMQRRENGEFETRYRVETTPRDTGIAEVPWTIPVDEAERFRCPAREPGYCQEYKLKVEGPGKRDETFRFTVAPARVNVRTAVGGTPDGGSTPVERTMELDVILSLRYPGGRALTWQDVEGPRNPAGVLAAGIERLEDDAWTRVDVVNLSFINGSRMWQASWVVPRDAPADGEQPHRIVTLPDQDRFGNVIPHQSLANFTVHPATLTPFIEEQPLESERLALTRFTLSFLYHDETPFEPGDNATTLTGCFVREGATFNGCGNENVADVEYWTDGLWNFTYRFPRDYEHLGPHEFRFQGATDASPMSERGQDTWGNGFRSFTGDIPFRVIPASPRVALTTVVDGETRDTTRGLDRGNTVAVTARITYPDGSAFNRSVNANGLDHVNATIVKRGPQGAPAGHETLTLESTSREGPEWAGAFDLSLNASAAPLGEWEIVFDIEDDVADPNRNETKFVRAVNPAEITVTTTRQPPTAVGTGSTLEYRFRLAYPNREPVTPGDVGSRLHVHVERVTPGEEGVVSGSILPSYDPDRDEWSMEWRVPPSLYQGTYVLKPGGTDRHGNVLDDAVTSRVFTTFTDSSTRPVLVQPPDDVERSDDVTAAFDGRASDLHFEPENRTHPPVIQLQRWHPGLEQWVVVREDVRVPAEDAAPDHVALFETSPATQLGVYRFHLIGRDSDYNLINGTTRSFTVEPTRVDRDLLVPPPERVAKGQPATWEISREDGDRIASVEILFEGRPLAQAREEFPGLGAVRAPIHTSKDHRFEFLWRIPLQTEPGAYSFIVTGRDAHGNLIEVEVPAVSAEPSVLTGRVLGNPDDTVPRGGAATFLFAVTSPSGGTFRPEGTPRVLVVTEDGYVADADVFPDGATYEARWTPTMQDAVDTYWFEVTGVDDAGNVFPALVSGEFRVTAGSFTREFGMSPARAYQRLDTVTADVPAEPSDAFVAFTLEYLGAENRLTEALAGEVEGTTVGNLEHTFNNVTERYEIEWRPERDTRTGAYRIAFTGQDAEGNAFRGESRPFILEPLTYAPVISATPRDAFNAGEPVEFRFRITHLRPTGERPDPVFLQPQARVTWNTRPLAQAPDVYHDPERGDWVAVWDVPEDLPPGVYRLVVQGQDDVGNPIMPRRGTAITVDAPAVLQGLVRAVPDAATPLALLVLVAAAFLARRRTRDA